MWEMAHSLNQQFLKEDSFVRLTEREIGSLNSMGHGSDGKVTAADIAMDVDFLTPSFQDNQIDNARNQQIIPFMQMVSNAPPSAGNLSFFNMFIEKMWVDVLKYPREDLYDDKGERILMTPPGFKSIYDVDIQQEIDKGVQAGAQAANAQGRQELTNEQNAQAAEEAAAAEQQGPPAAGPAAPEGESVAPELSEADIAELAESFGLEQ